MNGSVHFKRVNNEVLTLYNNYRGKIHKNKDQKNGLTRTFTLMLKAQQATLTDPLDLESFKKLLLKLHLYRGVNSESDHEVFYYFNPRIFHKNDPRCKNCDRVLDYFNTSDTKQNNCKDCATSI